MNILLETKKLFKQFGGVIAVTDLDLLVEKNSIHVIIGPNGAGKSTLIGLISGVLIKDRGKIFFKGEDITGLKPHRITGKGIGRTFQNIRLFGRMTSLENTMVACHCRSRNDIIATFFRVPFSPLSQEKAITEQSQHLLELVNLKDKMHIKASQLSLVDQRRLEFARALATQPDLILLDEPTRGMSEAESSNVEDLIITLAAWGLTFVFIAHDMMLIMNIAQMITVINFGEKIAEGSPDDIRENPKVVEAYLTAALIKRA